MNALTQIALPIFAVMLAGYLCGKTKLIPKGGTESINAFVYFFALPALFIQFLSNANINQILDVKIITAFLAPQLLIMGIIIITAVKFFPKNNNSENVMQSMSAVFSNTGYLGIPLMITAFGMQHTNIAIITTIINGAITLPLTLCLLEVARIKEGGKSFKRSLLPSFAIIVKSLITNPLLIGAAIGLFMSASEWKPSGSVKVFLELSGQAASPAALFAMGLFLAQPIIKEGRKKAKRQRSLEITYVSSIKIIFHPLLTYVLAVYILGLSQIDTAATVIMAALPTGGLVFLLAERQGCYKDKSAIVILLSTIISVLSVSLLIEYYTPVFVPLVSG